MNNVTENLPSNCQKTVLRNVVLKTLLHPDMRLPRCSSHMRTQGDLSKTFLIVGIGRAAPLNFMSDTISPDSLGKTLVHLFGTFRRWCLSRGDEPQAPRPEAF